MTSHFRGAIQFSFTVCVCVSVCVVGTTQVQHLGLADAVKEAV